MHMGFLSPGPFLVSSTQVDRMPKESTAVISPAAERRVAGLGTRTGQQPMPSSNRSAITEQNRKTGVSQTALQQASRREQRRSPC